MKIDFCIENILSCWKLSQEFTSVFFTIYLIFFFPNVSDWSSYDVLNHFLLNS